MDEHIDDAERRIRLKELQLALLRGDIGQAAVGTGQKWRQDGENDTIAPTE